MVSVLQVYVPINRVCNLLLSSKYGVPVLWVVVAKAGLQACWLGRRLVLHMLDENYGRGS